MAKNKRSGKAAAGRRPKKKPAAGGAGLPKDTSGSAAPRQGTFQPSDLGPQLKQIDKQIEGKLSEFARKRKTKVYSLLMGPDLSIRDDTVGDVLDDLRGRFAQGNERLDVIVDSMGGDIHAAYNLGLLFRRFATRDLTFIVPRSAKSAATLLVCSGKPAT